MNTLNISKIVEKKMNASIKIYRLVIHYRHDRLFTEFLPRGYLYTTLSSVDEGFHDQVMIAKFHLGMLITLLDDFADHPQLLKPTLLQEIYKLPYDETHIDRIQLNEHELDIIELARYLSKQLIDSIAVLPHYPALKDIFKFDLLRFYQANHYSELMTRFPKLVNSEELLQMRPFNMGMVSAAMIDVLASTEFDLKELGAARRIFHLGQRYGSISNNLITFKRELLEDDITNEITVKGLERHLINRKDLERLNHEQLLDKLSSIVSEITDEQNNIIKNFAAHLHDVHSFSLDQYVYGLKQFKLLHESMQEYI